MGVTRYKGSCWGEGVLGSRADPQAGWDLTPVLQLWLPCSPGLGAAGSWVPEERWWGARRSTSGRPQSAGGRGSAGPPPPPQAPQHLSSFRAVEVKAENTRSWDSNLVSSMLPISWFSVMSLKYSLFFSHNLGIAAISPCSGIPVRLCGQSLSKEAGVTAVSCF